MINDSAFLNRFLAFGYAFDKSFSRGANLGTSQET